MINEAIEAIMKSSKESSIYIGCDSQRFKSKKGFKATYSVVIILHLDSKHGCKLFHFTETLPDYGSLKQRLLTEAGYAVRAGSEIVDFLDGRPLSVHLDLNPSPKYASHTAVKEACGYVMGVMGFMPEIKPNSWAASTAADHIVRH